MRSRCVTGLVAWMTLAACGEAPEASQPQEAESPEVAAQALATGPDFVVTSVTGPTSVLPYQPLSLTVRACNQGTLPGGAMVELYLSRDNVITPNTPTTPSPDFMVGYVFMDLGVGECRTAQVQASSSVGADATYYLGAAADPMNALPEANENNNLRLGSRIGVGYLPDLVVSSVTGPTSTLPNQPFTASVSVCNQGTQPGYGALELYLSQDAVITPPVPPNPPTDVMVGSVYIQPLSPGQCRTEQVSAWASAPAEGTWYVGAAVDPGNSVVEFIEDNNTRAGNRIGVGYRPELVVTVLTGPTSALPGQLVSVTATVCNQGTQSGSAPVEWYLSQDTVITPNGSTDYYLGSSSFLFPLNPGQCETRTFATTVPSNFQGTYYVGAVVDPANGLQEFIEDNNTRVSSRIGFGEKPDFVVSSVSGTATVQPGGGISATVRVCNQGTVRDSADVELYLSQDSVITPTTTPGPGTDQPVGVGHVNLAAGECGTVTVTGGAPGTEGTFYLGAVVDPRGWTTELFEDNNIRAGNRIGVGYRPDFVVTSVTGPASAAPGQSFNVTATVCNQGTAPEYTAVEIYLSQDSVITPNNGPGSGTDYGIGIIHTGMLAPGACQTMPLPAYGGGPMDGTYYLGAAVDPAGMVTELFEDNNTRTGSRIGVGYRPDFVVTAVTGPASSRRDQSFNVSATVCNQGTQAEYAGEVEIYLSKDSVITPGQYGSGPDVNVGFAPIGMLAPGQCQTVTVPAYTNVEEGVWYLGAVVDPRNTRMEFLEDNNTRTGARIGIGDRPDFVVTSVTGPASTQRGQSFTASARVCNQGTVPGNTDVELYLSEDTVITPLGPSTPTPDLRVGLEYIGNLAPGQCQTVTVNAYAGYSLYGSLYLAALVDSHGTTDNELIEDNNTRVGGRVNVLP
ncbi:CARDB domain-containing protein [Pyxidicoccus caerfyrddinensis]|uniref:CARDB domain-containing protein n=1 Tax=Pyxidicoccus caerfyrddinensis TaxID=2709663 RepID=UPI0013D909CE|nr:CARDB domain-containing protein [Pyxidicoccus caerfyrddinensis]